MENDHDEARVTQAENEKIPVFLCIQLYKLIMNKKIIISNSFLKYSEYI